MAAATAAVSYPAMAFATNDVARPNQFAQDAATRQIRAEPQGLANRGESTQPLGCETSPLRTRLWPVSTSFTMAAEAEAAPDQTDLDSV